MMMRELWQSVDYTIRKFIKKQCEETMSMKQSSMLWNEPIYFSKKDPSKVLRGSKTIVSVRTCEDAVALKDTIRARLAESDLLVHDAKTLKKRPYKLNVKIIECLDSCGQIILKKSNIPVTKRNLSADDVIGIINLIRKSDIDHFSYLRDKYNSSGQVPSEISFFISQERISNGYFEENLEEIKERYARLLDLAAERLNANQKYCINYYKPCASSYRVTYSDASTYRRKQTTVGDVLIVIKGKSVVEDERFTQRRSDSFDNKHWNDRVMCVDSHTLGDVNIYKEQFGEACK